MTRVLAGIISSHIPDGHFIPILGCIDRHSPLNMTVHSVSGVKDQRKF